MNKRNNRRVLNNAISSALVYRVMRKMERRLVRVETRLVRLANGMKIKVK